MKIEVLTRPFREMGVGSLHLKLWTETSHEKNTGNASLQQKVESSLKNRVKIRYF